MDRPTLSAGPVVLRPFEMADAPHVAEIANDRSIYEMTLLVPYPYRIEDAESWIGGHQAAADAARGLDWAITRDGVVVGSVGITFRADDGRTDPHRPTEAAIGFWVGAKYRGHGYCTFAARAVARHVFETLGCARLKSFHFVGNSASGRVLTKIGMRNLGVTPGMATKAGRPVDCVAFELSREEWLAGS